MLPYQVSYLLSIDLGSAKGIDGDGGGLCHPNGVGDLNFAAVGQTGGNDILGHIAPGISCRAIHFGWVFAGEGPATMAGSATVGVNDDLATGEAAIADRGRR